MVNAGRVSRADVELGGAVADARMRSVRSAQAYDAAVRLQSARDLYSTCNQRFAQHLQTEICITSQTTCTQNYRDSGYWRTGQQQ